jgi:putative nucleotidyltransferase with HDIG domain
MIASLEDVQFSPETIATITSLPDVQWQAVVSETKRILDTTMRREIRDGQVPQVRRGISNQIGVDLSEAQADVVEEWVSALIVPNSFLDEERTEIARQQAREQVAPIEQTYEQGQIILRRGEVVTAEQVEALEELGLQRSRVDGREILGASLFALLLVLALGFYLVRLHPEVWSNQRYMLAIVALILGIAATAKILISIDGAFDYLVPSAAAAMLLAVLLCAELAMAVALVLALIVGYIGNSIELATYTFVGGVIAALSLHRVERLAEFVRAGVFVALANVGVVLAFGLTTGNRTTMEVLSVSGAAVTNGVISASLTLAGFYVLSNLLGITTFLQLMELARPTTPLFKELLLKAPGTYHHSIIVSNLAERAAEAVGADPLVARVGAYYHDIGKTLNPQFFVENQSNGYNPHDDLDDPAQSARIIISHVTEGVKLARKHGLPPRIIDFILQHHGTTTVTYFYHQACERSERDRVVEADFRYPGPRPQSRETAILLLADTVEAAARASRPDGPEAVEALVRKLVAKRIAERQLDECELTLVDLDRICRAFTEVLQGIYHPRIQYPGDEPVRENLPADVELTGEMLPVPAEGASSAEQRGASDRRTVGATG